HEVENRKPAAQRVRRVSTGGRAPAPACAPRNVLTPDKAHLSEPRNPRWGWGHPLFSLGRGSPSVTGGRIVCVPWCFPLGPGVRSPVVRGSPDVGIEVADQPIAAFRLILSAPHLVRPPCVPAMCVPDVGTSCRAYVTDRSCAAD